MAESAKGAGIELFIVSAFRSVERQAEIFRRKIASGSSVSDILTVSAPPGYSEHHTGMAVDVGVAGDSQLLEKSFENTDAFAWLASNASAYGFRLSYPEGNSAGYTYEPWHWCYKG
jgi:D-alanyl-D-alanine carboxypeptidase